MNLFSHFEDGTLTGAYTYRNPEYMAGEIEDIFDGGAVVVSLSPEEILDALCDGELLGTMDVVEEQVNMAHDSIKDWIDQNSDAEADWEVQA